MEGYNEELAKAVKLLREARLDASKGLPEELFWLVSSLTPIVNVDLLVVNDAGQLLLARRNDAFHPECWHIPGGCVRFGESLMDRVHLTAHRELGCDVIAESNPISIRDAIRGPIQNWDYPNERRHFVSILYKCYLPKGTIIRNDNRTEADAGYLKWFDVLPEDLVEIQHIYDDILEKWNEKREETEENGFSE